MTMAMHFSGFSPGLALLTDVAIKGTVLLLLATLLAWQWRRAPAASRHLLCAVTLGSLLILPLLTLALPGWGLPLPAPWNTPPADGGAGEGSEPTLVLLHPCDLPQPVAEPRAALPAAEPRVAAPVAA